MDVLWRAPIFLIKIKYNPVLMYLVIQKKPTKDKLKWLGDLESLQTFVKKNRIYEILTENGLRREAVVKSLNMQTLSYAGMS